MSEELKENEIEDTQVPLLSVSEEELEENKKKMEEAKNILTPPEGHVLAGLRSFCPIHGDITRASKIIKHTIYMKNEKTGKVEPVSFSDVVCLACLSELWRKEIVSKYPKDKDGNPQEIRISPVFLEKSEFDKIVAEQEAAESNEESKE